MGNGDHDVFLGNQVLNANLGFFFHDLGPALVTVFLLHFLKFLHDHLAQFYITCENLIQLGDLFPEFLQLVFDLLAFKTGQALQLHLENGLRLNLREFELGDQAFAGLGSILGRADQLDDGINVIQRLAQPFQNVSACFGLAQLVLSAAADDIHTVLGK